MCIRDRIKVTGKKLDQKIYYRHSDYVGGMKETTLKEMLNKHPERVIAVSYTHLDVYKRQVSALIEVRVTPQRGMGFDKVAERIYNYPEVNSVYLISGRSEEHTSELQSQR